MRLGCQRGFRLQASLKQSAPREGERERERGREDVEVWQTAALK